MPLRFSKFIALDWLQISETGKAGQFTQANQLWNNSLSHTLWLNIAGRSIGSIDSQGGPNLTTSPFARSPSRISSAIACRRSMTLWVPRIREAEKRVRGGKKAGKRFR